MSWNRLFARRPTSVLSWLVVFLFLVGQTLAGPGGGGGGGRSGGGRSGGGGFGGGGGGRSSGGGSGFSGGRGGSGGGFSGGSRSSGGPSGFSGSPNHGPSQGHGQPKGRPGGHPYAGGPHHPGGPYHPGGPGFHHPPYGWYHGDWHDHWAHPWGWGPVGWFSVGVVTGALVWDAPWYWGYWPYYNPYCVEVVVVDGVAIDYSRPIVVAPTTTTAAATGATTLPNVSDDEPSPLLEAARTAFSGGDYPTAMKLANQAIAAKPNDRTAHEFRSLVLFATAQYKAAAAAAYAVLAAGPGWDWATMSGLYSDPELYTTQLRALEQYRNAHPTRPEIRFLLAYHYMICEHPEAAAIELKEVVRLNPKDQLASQLLAGLSHDKSETVAAPEAESPPAESASTQPVEAAKLIGTWTASRSDGSSFLFTLSGADYSWKYTQNGKTQEFHGAYTLADNLLILKQNGNPVLIGQITPRGDQQFLFKLTGNNPNDPGLTFRKK